MRKEKIETPLVMIPHKGTSQAIKFGNILFIGGQTGRDVDGTIPEGIEAQVTLALERAKYIIDAAGGTMEDVLICHCYLKDPADFDGMNRAYFKVFGEMEDGPARCTVIAPMIYDEMLFEINMCVGLRNDNGRRKSEDFSDEESFSHDASF